MKYSVTVTNELFHNKNVEGVKNVISSYEKAYDGAVIHVFFEGREVENIDSLFTWGKLPFGAVFFFEVDFIGVPPQLSLLKKSLTGASSSEYEKFLSRDFCENLWDVKSDKISEDAFRKMLYPRVEGTSALPLLGEGQVTNFGGAVGAIFFSSESLMASDVPGILYTKNATADDVGAIKRCIAVIASEGGFSDHSSVLARQFGKPAVIFTGSFPSTLNEGDEITLDATENPGKIFFGTGEVLLPNGAEITNFCRKSAQKAAREGFSVMANCENASDAKRAMDFSAGGIGLFRTEHAFFDARRLPVFKRILFSKSREACETDLNELCGFLKDDFSEIFSLCRGKPVTLRLLDAPLSEFSEEAEKNSMLGFRGIRLAVAYPQIYLAETRAVLEAGKDFLQKNPEEKVEVRILLPMVCSSREVDFIINGREIPGFSFEGLKSFWEKNLPSDLRQRFFMEFAVMLETPAALEEIEKLTDFVRFFSFGTNDLTQFALGLSRNDSFRFLPLYEKFGIFPRNPFETLHSEVKSMIERAVTKAKSARSDAEFCLCGEQAFDEDTIKFCKVLGIKSLSCAPDKIPQVFYRY